MVNEKYLRAVESLTDSNKIRLSPERSPREKEKDKLFYWIISCLECYIQNCYPAQTSFNITIKEEYFFNSDYVLLRYGRFSEYLSHYVTKKEFYSIMQEVESLFNEIGENKKCGYCFSVAYFTKNGMAGLTIYMATREMQVE